MFSCKGKFCFGVEGEKTKALDHAGVSPLIPELSLISHCISPDQFLNFYSLLLFVSFVILHYVNKNE